MAGNTFEERLTRLEEEMKALQSLTRGLAAWEMGATSGPASDPDPAKARAVAHDVPVVDEGSEPRTRA